MRAPGGPIGEHAAQQTGRSGAAVALSAEMVFAELLTFKRDVDAARQSTDAVRVELGELKASQGVMISLLTEIRDLLASTQERQIQLLESLWKGGAQMIKLEGQLGTVADVVQRRVDQADAL